MVGGINICMAIGKSRRMEVGGIAGGCVHYVNISVEMTTHIFSNMRRRTFGSWQGWGPVSTSCLRSVGGEMPIRGRFANFVITRTVRYAWRHLSHNSPNPLGTRLNPIPPNCLGFVCTSYWVHELSFQPIYNVINETSGYLRLAPTSDFYQHPIFIK